MSPLLFVVLLAMGGCESNALSDTDEQFKIDADRCVRKCRDHGAARCIVAGMGGCSCIYDLLDAKAAK